MEEFEELGVTFISVKDNIDCSTAAGRLMVQMLGAFSEFESALIRERTQLGLDYAKSRGRLPGRPVTKKFQQILELRAKGYSYRKIVKELGVSPAVITRTLRASKSVSSSQEDNPVKTGAKSD